MSTIEQHDVQFIAGLIENLKGKTPIEQCEIVLANLITFHTHSMSSTQEDKEIVLKGLMRMFTDLKDRPDVMMSEIELLQNATKAV